MIKNYEQWIHINVDVQNDFCPGGSLAVAEGDRVVEVLNTLAARCRKLGGAVIHTRDWHPESTPHFAKDGGVWPVHCVAGTEGAAFHRDLDVDEGDIVISKGAGQEDAFSGFDGHDQNGRSLGEIIASLARGRTLVSIGGLATDYCVKATALDARGLAERGDLDLAVVVVIDGIRAVNLQPDDGETAVNQMSESGAHILTSGEILRLQPKSK